MKQPPLSATDQTVIVCTPNWLGDCVMAMPAIQAFCRHVGPRRLVVVSKPGLLPLWELHASVQACVPLHPGLRGLRAAARAVAAEHPGAAYVLPHSFRAAFVPWLARVPQRIGQRGHPPQCFFTQAAAVPAEPGRTHQAWESMSIFGVAEPSAALPAPCLRVPESICQAMRSRCGAAAGVPLIGVMPGAAYGPAKRWPVEHFSAAIADLVRQSGAQVVVLGSATEKEAAAQVTAAAGNRAVNLAGQTTLPELASVLEQCAVVLCNDSGGMHLAAAMGTPVVAIYGVTDPSKTGPLGRISHQPQRLVTKSASGPGGSGRTAWLEDVMRCRGDTANVAAPFAPARRAHHGPSGAYFTRECEICGLGQGHRLVLAEDVQRARDLDRDSARAQRVLASIPPDRVVREALAVLLAGRSA